VSFCKLNPTQDLQQGALNSGAPSWVAETIFCSQPFVVRVQAAPPLFVERWINRTRIQVPVFVLELRRSLPRQYGEIRCYRTRKNIVLMEKNRSLP